MPTDPAEGGVVAYIGIGSNLGDPDTQVERAFSTLAHLPDSLLVACSNRYCTAPIGPADQPDYVNAVASIHTRLDAWNLLSRLQFIEQDHGRTRKGPRWGPRPLDLDILLYGGAVIDRPGLRIPHPELARRAFVLVPLADIAPNDLLVPGQGRLGDLLAACTRDGVQRLGPPVGCEGMLLAAVADSPGDPETLSLTPAPDDH